MKWSPTTRALALLTFAFVLVGCTDSTSTKKPTGKGTPNDLSELTEGGGASAILYDRELTEPIMEEIDGFPVARMESTGASLDLNAPIPVDAGNDAARGDDGGPVSGGLITVRMPSEPKSMNPMTETSAAQTYITYPYVTLALADQNPETFDYEPMLATRWIIEDSVKLAPDYPGYERYVSLAEGEPQTSLSVDVPKSEDENDEPATLKFTTYGPEKRPLGDVWIGLFPEGKVVGANKNGHHFWSGEDGSVEVVGLPEGTYTVKVGYEVFGVTEEADGGIKLKPESPQNPLAEMLSSNETEYLELDAGQYVDIQRDTVFTYFLDPDAKWSDGAPYTSRDLEFAMEVLRNPIVDCESKRSYYRNVTRCDGLDEHTVRMQYREQYFLAFEFTAGLAMYGPPLHFFEDVFEKQGKTLTFERLTEDEEQAQNKVSVHGGEFAKFFNNDPQYNEKPLGTGPYTIASWRKGERITLKRNPNYWTEKKKGYLDEITFKFINDDSTAISALEGREIDFLFDVNAEKFHESLSKSSAPWLKGKYVKQSWYIPMYSYIGWNLNKELFADRRIRVALALLFDLETFIELKQYGEAVPVSGSQYIFGPAYDRKVKPIGYDQATARDLLSEAGWADTDGDGILDKDGKKFEFEFMFSTGSETAMALSELFQETAKQVGIKINVKLLEWASYLERIQNKDFDVVTLSWVSAPESDPYQLWHSSGAGEEARSSNHVSFDNARADELIEASRVTLDPAERQALFHEFHRVLDREQPYMFLYTRRSYGVYDNRYRGVKWYRLRPGFDLTEWYVPKNLQR